VTFSTFDVDLIRKLSAEAEHVEEPPNWLPTDPSAAYLVCVGAGPWRYQRRLWVQQAALQTLGTRDLSQLETDSALFPLSWQNMLVHRVVNFLKRLGITMLQYNRSLRGLPPWDVSQVVLHDLGLDKPYKVLSLYLRDYLKVPSFPVDRHVKRALSGFEKQDETYMVRLCRFANVDPLPIARMLVKGKLDVGNPNWSGWPYRFPKGAYKGEANA